MMRWFFLFLLLANAITLLWHSLHVAPVVQAERQAEASIQLRLVSELASVDEIPKKSECFYFRGLEAEVEALAVSSLINEKGFVADVVSRLSSVEYGYQLLVLLPERLELKLTAMDIIERHGGFLVEQDADDEYRFEEIADKSVALSKMEMLRAEGLNVELQPRQKLIKYYDVRVKQSIDRKLPNKIKEVVKERYSLQKIEKKVCKGVAKP